MIQIDARAGQYIDYTTPSIPSSLPARDRVAYAELATEILRRPFVAEEDLASHLKHDAVAMLRVKILGGKYVYPAFQFDETGRLNSLIATSAHHLGYGFKRLAWWFNPNEDLEGRAPADLLGKSESQNDILKAIESLPVDYSTDIL